MPSQNALHFLQLANHPCCYVVRGRTVVTGNGLQIAKIGMIVGLN
jgi:hypothetical protein